jgi:tetratricopeptide (TPR) repeat protein
MGASRIDIFKQMLEGDPANTSVLFGLAKEYEKTERYNELIETLEKYLEHADDEGNAYGMLARAYEKRGERERARQCYSKGIEVAMAHGHPSMAEDYRMTLETDYGD